MKNFTFSFVFGVGFLGFICRFQFHFVFKYSSRMFLICICSFTCGFHITFWSQLKKNRQFPISKRIIFIDYMNFFRCEQCRIINRSRYNFFDENSWKIIDNCYIWCRLKNKNKTDLNEKKKHQLIRTGRGVNLKFDRASRSTNRSCIIR